MAGIWPDRPQSGRVLAHPDAGDAPVRAMGPQQVEAVLHRQPVRMLGGYGQTLLQGEWEAVVGIDEFASHIGFPVDIAGTRVGFQNDVEGSLGGFESVLWHDAGNIPGRHGCESGHPVDAGTGYQGLGADQLPGRYEQDSITQLGPLQGRDKRLGQGSEGRGADVGHVRIAQGHDSVQLPPSLVR